MTAHGSRGRAGGTRTNRAVVNWRGKGRLARAPVVRRPVSEEARGAVRELVKASQAWSGPGRNSIFAQKFIGLAKELGLSPGALAEATLRRVDTDEHAKLLAIITQLAAKR